MSTERNSGILLHISSLPGKFGIGDFGPSAYKQVDLLTDNGFRLWQILPVGPLGAGNSPYQAYSAYAIDPIYCSPELLVEWGLLENDDCTELPQFNTRQVEFDKVRGWKEIMLERAWNRFKEEADQSFRTEYQNFLSEHGWWLKDYALFTVLMSKFGSGRWNTWGEGLRDREPDEMNQTRNEFEAETAFEMFKQFMVFRQYFRLKDYANSRGIQIFGDMPLYVAYESSDVWANQDLFLLDGQGQPAIVGGVPPDYFSEEGQLWGNPVFNWDNLAASDYQWWLARIYFNLHLYNLVRIDHFRGLESFWAIPADSDSAKTGTWIPAHGHALLSVLKTRMKHLPIVAEDLGLITHEVKELRDRFDLPGMRVLQFAFDENGDGVHLPHQYRRNSLVYTGTHDNNTLKGWWNNLDRPGKQNVLDYVGGYRGSIADRLIELAWSSVARTAIIPMQDVLGLGASARMNTPGIATGNWGWRFEYHQTTRQRLDWFKKLNKIYQR